MKLPNRSLPWPITWAGVVEIARSESCRLTAYRDIVGVWTIGWGRTRNVHEGMTQTQTEADRDLLTELTNLANQVRAACVIEPTPNQLAAMVSLAYNIGMGWTGPVKPKGAKDGFRQSSVLRAHNRVDFESAGRAFALWNKAGGQVVRGLVARRQREAALYMTPDELYSQYLRPASSLRGELAGEPRDEDYREAPATPEADPETRLHASPIAQSGAVSIATGGLAAASAVSDDVRSVAWSMSIDPLLVVAAVAIVVGAVVLYQRYKQRAEGWA
ncbi:glycoside hydrolase family protein [Azoarcus communis]|uniref:glycoside hydrolase family protein n=1 Tax=Parazoarcus communis TaxID=41977 RepID=UPI0014596C42|nr:glycoside hydrolase family protein [Parazoarcus communis]